MGYTLCMVKECSNLTTDEFSEYGTYCFEHSNLTNSPILTKNYQITSKLKSLTVSLGKLNKPFDSVYIYSSSKPERKVKSTERKIPVVLDNSKRMKTTYEKMDCCVCENKDFISNKMKCGHLVCLECLDHIRSFKCPLCQEEMEGILLTNNILEEIEVRYREDLDERGEEDKTMSNLALLGYNPDNL
jgi:hypothetical protein